MPFLVVAVEGALRSVDGDAELMAATLGAGPSRVLWQVTMPALRPAIVSGASLAAARALGVRATVTFAGSLQGTDPDAAIGDLPSARWTPTPPWRWPRCRIGLAGRAGAGHLGAEPDQGHRMSGLRAQRSARTRRPARTGRAGRSDPVR
ncbi:MAG: ABC transporter permease subunit [Micropruina glycogenica]